MITISYLYGDVFEQGDMQKKSVSKGWCKKNTLRPPLMFMVYKPTKKGDVYTCRDEIRETE